VNYSLKVKGLINLAVKTFAMCSRNFKISQYYAIYTKQKYIFRLTNDAISFITPYKHSFVSCADKTNVLKITTPIIANCCNILQPI